jgi:CBS domain-containing protein
MLKVADLMTREVMTVPPEMSVKSAAKLLFEKEISGLPVVDAERRVIGMITEKDIINMAMPKYLQEPEYQDFAYILDTGPFWKKVAEAEKLAVKDIMRKDVLCVSGDMSVPEVARLMISKGIRRIPVLKDKKLVGIIARADIVREIAKETGIIE